MFRIFSAVAAIGLAFSAPATAQDRSVQLLGDVMAIQSVTDESGNESAERIEPKIVTPGDRLVFITNYRNTGAETVTDFVITNPLPRAIRLAPDADANLTVTVDGGQNWGKLADLTVAMENGESRAATQADVTHIRWTLSTLEPRQRGALEYPAIVR